MVFESSIAPQVAPFADSLNVRPARSVEKTPDEQSQQAKTPEQGGDTITISEEARALIAAESTGNEDDSPFDLTKEQEERSQALFEELDAIFRSGKDTGLSAEQETRVDEIFGELDEIHGAEGEFILTEDEKELLDTLFLQLDTLHANETMTPDQEMKAEEIEEKIESIFMAAVEREELIDGGMNVFGNSSSSSSSSAATAESESQSASEQTIERLKEQIEKLEEEIEALEKSDLPEKEKLQQIQAKQVQLMELNDQLLSAEEEMLKASGQSVGGGTRASGFGNSVASF